MKPIHTLLFLLWGSASIGQTVATFSVEQPPQFLVDAGADVDYQEGMTIGGAPTATGGGGSYAFSWQPAELLSNPTTANPIVLSLDTMVTFTVSVTDLITGCVKNDQISILSTGIQNSSLPQTQIFPNPTSGLIHLRSSENMERLTVRSISGSILLDRPGIRTTDSTIDLSPFSEGFYFIDVTFSSGHTQTYKLCRAAFTF